MIKNNEDKPAGPDYRTARNEMLARTRSIAAPWTVVCALDKHHTRLWLISDLLTRLGEASQADYALTDPNSVFPYDSAALEQGLITP